MSGPNNIVLSKQQAGIIVANYGAQLTSALNSLIASKVDAYLAANPVEAMFAVRDDEVAKRQADAKEVIADIRQNFLRSLPESFTKEQLEEKLLELGKNLKNRNASALGLTGSAAEMLRDESALSNSDLNLLSGLITKGITPTMLAAAGVKAQPSEPVTAVEKPNEITKPTKVTTPKISAPKPPTNTVARETIDRLEPISADEILKNYLAKQKLEKEEAEAQKQMADAQKKLEEENKKALEAAGVKQNTEELTASGEDKTGNFLQMLINFLIGDNKTQSGSIITMPFKFLANIFGVTPEHRMHKDADNFAQEIRSYTNSLITDKAEKFIISNPDMVTNNVSGAGTSVPEFKVQENSNLDSIRDRLLKKIEDASEADINSRNYNLEAMLEKYKKMIDDELGKYNISKDDLYVAGNDVIAGLDLKGVTTAGPANLDEIRLSVGGNNTQPQSGASLGQG